MALLLQALGSHPGQWCVLLSLWPMCIPVDAQTTGAGLTLQRGQGPRNGGQ